MKKLLFLLPLLACILMGCHDEPKPTPPKYPTYPTFNANDCAALHDLYVTLGVDTAQLYNWPHWTIPKFDGVELERDWDADELRVVSIDISYSWVPEGFHLDASFDFTRFERLRHFEMDLNNELGYFEIPPSIFTPNMKGVYIIVRGNREKAMELPKELFDCKETLKALSLRGLKITDPDFLKKISEFNPNCAFRFLGNGFNGKLPEEVAKLKDLDLSYNDFTEIDMVYFYYKDAILPSLHFNSNPIHIHSAFRYTDWWEKNQTRLQGTELIWIEP